MVKYPYRSKRKMTYHGRSGYPKIHKCKTSNKTYIMVRKKGGGVKRLYLTSKVKKQLYSKEGVKR